jgi:hypothetical protein
VSIFSSGSGGGFHPALNPSPVPGEKKADNTAALRGSPLGFFSSEKTSRVRLPSFTRDDSPIKGWQLA